MKTLVIIPTYNERENAPKLAEEIFKTVPGISVLIVDDNSPDKTAEEIKKIQPRYPQLFLLERPGKEGLGKAYVDAFKKTIKENKFDSIIMMDGDFSHSPKYLPEMLKQAEKYDVVIGSRYTTGGGVSEKWGLHRKFLSRFANFYLKTILGRPINDWTGGFNFIKLDTLKKVDLDSLFPKGYAFIFGLKHGLLKTGASVKEIPIVFEEREKGKSKMSGNIITEAVIAPWKIILRK